MPPRARQRWAPIILLVPLGLLLAGVAGAWRMTWQAPQWWSPPDPSREQTVLLAERVEYRLAEEAHKVRSDDDPWLLRVTEDQVNAWLAARLPAWVAHTHALDWPQGIGVPQIHFNDNTVNAGIDFADRDRRRYLVASLSPRLVEGKLVLVLEGVSLGRVWIPGRSIRSIPIDRIMPAGYMANRDIKRLVDLLIDEQRIDPTFELADGRRVRLREISFDQGELIVECETNPARSQDRERD